MIYTSSSTGQPKGCAIPYGNIVQLFRATRDEFRFTASDVWSLFHS